jgi:hypothetical protein
MTYLALQQVIKNLAHETRWNVQKYFHESVYFYTFHKCASSMFSDYVLKNIKYLRHVDYASILFNGGHVDKIEFKKHGYIYGPLRISTVIDSILYQPLVSPSCKDEFVRDKTTIFLIRDPRDILISAYYSFGFSHVLSPVQEIREEQIEKRNSISSQSLDDFALEHAMKFLSYFETLGRLQQASKHSVTIKYEDMIDNWERFVEGLTTFLVIDRPVLDHIHEITRPRQTENKELHRRSGETEQYKHKLTAETVSSLNETFKEVLARYQYQV